MDDPKVIPFPKRERTADVHDNNDARRHELEQLLDQDDETPFEDPWPDWQNK